MNAIFAFFDAHPLFSWFVFTSLANILIDLFGKRNTAFGKLAKRIGTDLKGIAAKRPGGPLSVAIPVILMTQEACSWFKGDAGVTTVTTPYGSVQRKGPYIPDPAPTTNVYVWCGMDAGGVVDASSDDAR